MLVRDGDALVPLEIQEPGLARDRGVHRGRPLVVEMEALLLCASLGGLRDRSSVMLRRKDKCARRLHWILEGLLLLGHLDEVCLLEGVVGVVVHQIRLHLLGKEALALQVLQHLEQAPDLLRREVLLLAGSLLSWLGLDLDLGIVIVHVLILILRLRLRFLELGERNEVVLESLLLLLEVPIILLCGTIFVVLNIHVRDALVKAQIEMVDVLPEGHVSVFGGLLRVVSGVEVALGVHWICIQIPIPIHILIPIPIHILILIPISLPIDFLCKFEILGFGNISDPSPPSLAFGRLVVRIKDLVLRIQGRNCVEAPINIRLVLLVEGEDPRISLFLQFLLDDAKQNDFFRRSRACKIGNFMSLGAVLDEVLHPHQVFHVADGALDLWEDEALFCDRIVKCGLGELSSLHGD